MTMSDESFLAGFYRTCCLRLDEEDERHDEVRRNVMRDVMRDGNSGWGNEEDVCDGVGGWFGGDGLRLRHG